MSKLQMLARASAALAITAAAFSVAAQDMTGAAVWK